MKWNREAVLRALSPRNVFETLRDAVIRDVGLKLLSLLVAFASHADLAPAEVERARAALSGQRWQRESA